MPTEFFAIIKSHGFAKGCANLLKQPNRDLIDLLNRLVLR